MKTSTRIILVIAVVAVAVLLILHSSKNVAPEPQLPVSTASRADVAKVANSSIGTVGAVPLPTLVTAPEQTKTPSALTPYRSIVEAKYGLVLSSFKIAPERLERLKKLLAEREAAKLDLSELKGSQDVNVSLGARAASKKIDDDFRKEAQGALAASEWPNVSRMLEVEYTLFGLEHEVAGPLVKSGDPLSGSQLFLAADKVHMLFADGAGESAQYVATIDPTTHLTAADDAVLRQLSGSLSSSQISAIRASLTARNERLARVAASRSEK